MGVQIHIPKVDVDALIAAHAAIASAHHTAYTDALAVAAAEAAGLALADGKNIKIEETLGTDHTWSGITCGGTTGLSIGQVVYRKSDSTFAVADADAFSTMPVVAIATNTSGIFLLHGYMRDDSWNWTVGGLLYADEGTGGTAGGMTQLAPSGTGDQIQVVGVALTADIIYFNPSPVLVEHA